MIHKNSTEIYHLITEDGSLNHRETAVMKIFMERTTPLRDYDVLQIFKPGSDNVNLVQPRISSLHDKELLKEGPPMKSPYKDCNVRTSVLNCIDNEAQMGLGI